MIRNLGILLPVKNEKDERSSSFELGWAQVKEQDRAERDRLLYVALTRAEQMLLINGAVRRSKSGSVTWSGWLGELAEITGLKDSELPAYDDMGAGRHEFKLAVEETAILATIFGPEYQFEATSPISAIDDSLQFPDSGELMREPVIKEVDRKTAVDVGSQVGQHSSNWTVQEGSTDQAMGLIVHEALATWRFPEDGFEEWVRKRIVGFRLAGESQVKRVIAGSSAMLSLFKQHKLGQEIDRAERCLHEVPYSVEQNGLLDNGRIDLLFKNENRWTVVDFKSGYIGSDAAFQRLLDEGVAARLQQYGTAVQNLLGSKPRLLLCHLNYQGAVRVYEVKPPPP